MYIIIAEFKLFLCLLQYVTSILFIDSLYAQELMTLVYTITLYVHKKIPDNIFYFLSKYFKSYNKKGAIENNFNKINQMLNEMQN